VIGYLTHFEIITYWYFFVSMFRISDQVWKGMQMGEVITVLTSATGHALVKSFSGEDITPQPFSTGKLFNLFEEPISDLKGLSALLQRLENDPTHTVIRGSPTDDQCSPVPRKLEYFTTIPRQWCMIDIDSIAWDGDLSDQQAMLSYAIQQLPPEFQSADCWYHFSSSMGIKAGINAHLWFWLDRPCSDNEMKAWISGCPVDMRMFNPIQIHLTANPQFSDGAVDPYPNRSGLFEAGTGISTVTVPSDLAFRSAVASKSSKQRASG
jgi:putative DNA primase/helicase